MKKNGWLKRGIIYLLSLEMLSAIPTGALAQEDTTITDIMPSSEAVRTQTDAKSTAETTEATTTETAVETEQTTEETTEETVEDTTAEALVTEETYYSDAYLNQDANVYADWDTASEVLTALPSGYKVYVTSLILSDEEPVWARAILEYQDYSFDGYISVEALDIYGEGGIMLADDSQSFPDSYQKLLNTLQKQHPNWIFKPIYVGDTFDYAVSQQVTPKAHALVSMYYYNEGFRSLLDRDYNYRTNTWTQWEPGWAGASEATVRYYMDPRNFLNEDDIFMFEALTYESSYQTEAVVESVLKGTFMYKAKVDNSSYTYAKLFVWIGKNYNINPVALASRVRQEQGVSGDSGLISGKYPGYEGLYNYFNMGATGSTKDEIITNGLKEAQTGSTFKLPNGKTSKGAWNTRMKALIGGALKFRTNYIARNQNTLYAQKFDYDGEYDDKYWHQYMTNISAPYSEGRQVKNSYSNIGQLENSFVFYIPVYDSMPSSSPKPTERKNFNNCINQITVNGKNVISTFDKNQTDFYYNISKKTSSINVKVTAASDKATVSFENIGETSHQVAVCNISVTAEDGTVAQYRLLIGNGVKIEDGFFQDFDPYVYRNRYSDLQNAFGSDINAYYEHYYVYGKNEGRNASKNSFTGTKPKVTVKQDKSNINVSWNKVSGASGYYVYRKTASEDWKRIASVSASKTSYTDTSATAGTSYYYTVRGYHEGGKTGFKSSALITCLTVPTVKSVAYSGTNVKVSWNSVSGAKGYYVYRKTDKGDWKQLAKVSGTSYTDKTTVFGTSYYYTVRAYHDYGKGNYKSSSLFECISAPVVTVKNVSNGVKVSWNTVNGAAKYRVYRKTSSGSWERLKEMTGTSYTDTTAVSGTEYYYTARAYKKNWSAYKQSALLKYISAPVVTVKNVSNGVKVSWGAVNGAAKYRVYRRTASGGWETLKDVTGTSYTDKTAVSGTNYYYTARAYGGTWSAYKQSSLITYLAMPTVKSVAYSGTNVKVSWNSVSGAKGYYVYRKTGKEDWKRLAKVSGTSYTDKTTSFGTSYYYTVRAYHDHGKSDYKSSSLFECISAPVVTVKNVSNGVKVSWNTVNGATKYRVYRKTRNGSWERLKEMTGTSYTDKTAVSGTEYYYTARAYKKNWSAYKQSALLKYISAPVVTVRNVSNGVKVSWSAVNGAAKYYVYRRTTSGGWQELKNVTGTSYTDKTAVSGTSYYYTARAYGDTWSAYTQSALIQSR